MEGGLDMTTRKRLANRFKAEYAKALKCICQLGARRLTMGKLTGLPVAMLPVCRGSAGPVGGFLGYCMRAWVLR